jgi:ATP-dependent RNA helicase RhlE
MVATDIAARGIDVAGVTHVINYDVPENPEDYVHRIGRTGRAQAVGDAFTLVTPENAGDVRDIERFIGAKIPELRLEGFDYKPLTARPQPQHPQRGGGGRPQGRNNQRGQGGRGGYNGQSRHNGRGERDQSRSGGGSGGGSRDGGARPARENRGDNANTGATAGETHPKRSLFGGLFRGRR